MKLIYAFLKRYSSKRWNDAFDEFMKYQSCWL